MLQDLQPGQCFRMSFMDAVEPGQREWHQGIILEDQRFTRPLLESPWDSVKVWWDAKGESCQHSMLLNTTAFTPAFVSGLCFAHLFLESPWESIMVWWDTKGGSSQHSMLLNTTAFTASLSMFWTLHASCWKAPGSLSRSGGIVKVRAVSIGLQRTKFH